MHGLRITALAGGVGGAKLADGLAQVMQPEELTVIVNTGDDFIHLGLNISPDLDTVCYTLAGLENPSTGWGRVNETWNVFTRLKEMEMPDWFQLGDTDIATHLIRTSRLRDGWKLSEITQEYCRKWGIPVRVLPMSDDIVRTHIISNEGEMEFQEYFVHRKCEPIVNEIKFIGTDKARPSKGVLGAIEQADAIVFCPSNPWVSIDPILLIIGIREAIEEKLVFAVSPIIGDQTVKGPAAKMFSEFGIKPSALAVAEHYGDLVDGFFIDLSDARYEESITNLGIHPFATDILMRDRADRGRLAGEVLKIINSWETVN